MGERMAKKVLLVGWDGADWRIINPLLDSGRMPALESIVNRGVMGNIATLDPPISPMLWTSIATGMHADKHGILNFTEPAPQKGGIRPVMASSRKVKAVWNILTQQEFKTHVVGWWPSHPAEPINGICISNFYQRAHAPIDKPWPMRPGTVYPDTKEKIFDELRIHPSELTAAHILPFVPEAAKVNQEKDKKLESLIRAIADCSTVHMAATWILENEPWDFMAVYYDAIDHFCHGFMNYHPPRMPHVPEEMFHIYKGVVTGAYLYHDMMLSRLLELAGKDATVILVSDHGFHSDHLRPRGIPREPAGPAWQHRSYGIFCMSGPHVRHDERIYGARLLDITPTILTLFGLPIGQDMDGKPLIQSFEKPFIPETIQSWEEIKGECGMLSTELQQDPYAEQEAMNQLIALGYMDKPEKDIQKAIDRTINESKFYLARVYMNKNLPHEALPILEALVEKHSDQIRYVYHLAKCYESLGRTADSRRVIEHFINKEKKHHPQFDLLLGSLSLAEKQFAKALELLQKAEKAEPRMPTLHQHIGQAYMRMGLFEDAERAYFRALEIDPDSHIAHDGFAQVYLRQHQYEKAASYALNAVGLLHHFPLAHYHLGMALAKLNRYDRAIEALEVCAMMAPGYARVHRMLVHLYLRKLRQPENAARHQLILDKLNKK
ncbi:alkaline phosphatase family protein [bacterium]|nr:alkaline phosphatase family protein [bacterium]